MIREIGDITKVQTATLCCKGASTHPTNCPFTIAAPERPEAVKTTRGLPPQSSNPACTLLWSDVRCKSQLQPPKTHTSQHLRLQVLPNVQYQSRLQVPHLLIATSASGSVSAAPAPPRPPLSMLLAPTSARVQGLGVSLMGKPLTGRLMGKSLHSVDVSACSV